MGNHDEYMIDFLFNNKNNIENWLNFGLDQTIRSYGIELVDFIKDGFGDDIIEQLRKKLLNEMSEDQINFFKSLELSYSSDKYLFEHAWIDPKKSLSEQTRNDYLWSRSEDFFKEDFKAEKIIVHGHTPVEKIISNQFRINIDSGCYFSGKLTGVCLSDKNDSRTFITN